MSKFEQQLEQQIPDLPRGLQHLIGLMLAKLEEASHDTGRNYYLEFSPIDSRIADRYQVDGTNQEPRDVFRDQ